MNLIDKVTTKDGYILLIKLESGRLLNVDFSNKLNTYRFSQLTDKNLFSHVQTDGIFVIWPNGLKVSASELCSEYCS